MYVQDKYTIVRHYTSSNSVVYMQFARPRSTNTRSGGLQGTDHLFTWSAK